MKPIRGQKRKANNGNRAGWRAFWPAWLLFALLIGLFGFNLVGPYLEDLPKRSDVPVTRVNSGHDLDIASGSLEPGKLHLFETVASGQKIQFLVQRTHDGVVHAALATCRSCIRSRTSHYARNGEYFCGQCKHAMRFETDESDNQRCPMPEIPHSESNGMLTVRESDIMAISDRMSQ